MCKMGINRKLSLSIIPAILLLYRCTLCAFSRADQMSAACCLFHEGSGTPSEKKQTIRYPLGRQKCAGAFFSFLVYWFIGTLYNFTRRRSHRSVSMLLFLRPFARFDTQTPSYVLGGVGLFAAPKQKTVTRADTKASDKTTALRSAPKKRERKL